MAKLEYQLSSGYCRKAYKALCKVSPIDYSEFKVVKDGVKLKVPYGEYASSFSPFRKNCYTIANALLLTDS